MCMRMSLAVSRSVSGLQQCAISPSVRLQGGSLSLSIAAADVFDAAAAGAGQVRGVFWRLLSLCPTPEAAVAADVDAIRAVITPLGLHNKRAVAVRRLSHDFLHKQVGSGGRMAREWRCGCSCCCSRAWLTVCVAQQVVVQPLDPCGQDSARYCACCAVAHGCF